MTLFIHRTVLSLGFRFIGAVAAVVVLDVARAATQVKTPGTQPITNPAVPAPIRMGLAQEWIFVPLPAGVEPLASSEQGHVVLLRSNPWNYVRWESGLEFRLKPDRNIGAYTEAAQATESNMKTIIYAVSKNGSIALNYQLFDGGLSRPGKIEEFTLVWAPGSFSPRPVLGDFMPIDNTNNWNDIGQLIWNSRRPGRMITLDGEDYLWGYFAYRLSPTAPLREYPFRVNPNTEQIGQATLVAPDIQVMAVSRGAAHSVGVRFVEVSQDNGTVVRQPVAGTLDNAPLSFLPIYVNDNGVVLGAAHLNQWNDPYVAATLVYSVQKGIRPLPAGGRVTWIDEQDRLHGFDAPTGGNPVMWVVKTAPDGSLLPQLEYVKVPYVPMPNPANWVTDHLIPPGTRMPQLGKMTNSTTGQRRPFIAVRGGAPVDSNRDGQIVVGGSPSADAINPTGPYFLPVNNKAGDGTPNWDDSRVNGANDLKNFYPVFLDIKALVRALPPSAKIKYRLKHADGAINYVLTDLTAATAFDFRQDPRPTGYGLFLGQPAFFAQTTHVTWSGSDLFDPAAGPPLFLNRILNHDGGVILIEARGPTDKPLVLSVEQYDSTLGTVVLTEIKLPLLTAGLSLAVDASRDGTIKVASEDDSDATSANGPYRFWLNDDDDSGDISYTGATLVGNPDEPGYLSGFWEMDGRTPDHDHSGVDGRSDLIDFFPVYLDIKQLLKVLPHTAAGIAYKLKQADSALNFVYTDLTRAEAFDYLKYNRERVAYGLPSNQKKAHEASTVLINATGAPLDADFLARIKYGADKGVILVEGKLASDKPLRLVVEKDDIEIAEISLSIKISEIEKMYRWANLRGVTGQSVTRQTNLAEPTNYPDKGTNGKMFIFVHGYNVNERQSRAWNSEAFKRMYQSGSRAMFTAVSWNGDHSQVPYVGFAPDYWDNVTRSFRTAQALAPIVNGLPGSAKVIAGHSMGNIFVSSAIVDHGMNVTKYLMINAAVALEAYDTSALQVNAMRNPDWATYTDRRVWPTDWYDLFPVGDGRRGLTWMDRFGNIPNAVNIYSSGEQVLNNNDLTPGEIPNVLGAERVWVIQEMAKGTLHVAALLTFNIQGGWGFNSEWLIANTTTTGGPHGGTTTTYRKQTPAEAATLTDDQLRAEPFFRPFKNDDFTSPTGGSAAASSLIPRADALGGAIPALSFPAGGNPVPLFDNTNRNRNLMDLQDGWPQARLNDEKARLPNVFPPQGRWFHSDIKNIAYVFNRGAWELFATEGNLK
jgi:hypothetical protein